MTVGRYAPGDRQAVVTDHGLVLLGAHVPMTLLERVWQQATAGRGLPAVLEALTGAFGTSLAAIPPFAVVLREESGVRIVVRGALEIEVETSDGIEHVSGAGVTTWTERSVAGASRVTVVASPPSSPDEYPVRDGIVLASAVTLDLAEGTDAAPARPAASDVAPVAAAAADVPVVNVPVVDVPVVEVPVIEVPVAGAPEVPVVDVPVAEVPVVDVPVVSDVPVAEVPVVEVPEVPLVDVPAGFGDADGRFEAQGATDRDPDSAFDDASEILSPEPEPDPEREREPEPSLFTQPEVEFAPEDEPGFEPVVAHEPEPEPEQVPEPEVEVEAAASIPPFSPFGGGVEVPPAPPLPFDPPPLIDSSTVMTLSGTDTLLPAESTFGHASDDATPVADVDLAATIARPAAPTPSGDHDGETISVAEARRLRGFDTTDSAPPPLAAPRPPAPGRVRLSTGQVLLLDRTIVIGRRPRSTRVVGTDLPHLVAVESPEQDISRSHVELRVEGDSVVATDLHTTNGTTLHRAGTDPVRLHPGEATVVVPGDLLDLGDGITVTIEDLA